MTEAVLQQTAAIGMERAVAAHARLDALEKKCTDFQEEIRRNISLLLDSQGIRPCQIPPSQSNQ